MSFTTADQLPGGQSMAAFLDMLAWSEGTSTSPATKCDGYDVIVTGIDKKPEIFTDFSVHKAAGKSAPPPDRGTSANHSTPRAAE